MTALAELIARLEVATAGSRELDIAVYEAIGWRRKQFSKTAPTWLCPPDDGKRIAIEPFNLLPCVTTSIDAALTLVPENWWAEIHARTDTPSCVLHEFPLPCRRVPSERPYVLVAATPALALCIAALKARKAQP